MDARERVDGREDRPALEQELVDRIGELFVDMVGVDERHDGDVLRQFAGGGIERDHLVRLAEFGEEQVGRTGLLFTALRDLVADRKRTNEGEFRAVEARGRGDQLGKIELQEAFARRVEHRHGLHRIGLLGGQAEVSAALRGAHRGDAVTLGALFFLRVRARVGDNQLHFAAGGRDVFAEERLDAARVAFEVWAQLHVGAADEEFERHRFIELGDDPLRAW